MIVEINNEGNLSVPDMDADKVVKRNIKMKNQSIVFKSGFYGEHVLDEGERFALDEVTLVTQADGTKILNCNLAYEPRIKAYQKMLKSTFSRNEEKKLHWIKTQRQVVMKQDSNGCYIDQILDTSTETDYSGRSGKLQKFTDVYMVSRWTNALTN